MIKTKLIKAMFLGISMALLSSNTVFAAEKENTTVESQTHYAETGVTSVKPNEVQPEDNSATTSVASDQINPENDIATTSVVSDQINPENDIATTSVVSDQIKPENDITTTSADSEQIKPEINSAISDKQSEIDQYLFVDHAKEIADKGITVTHTAPMDTYVEIGILPYNDTNAEYIYNNLGKDNIKVIEGVEVETMVADSGMSVTSTDNEQLMYQNSSPIAGNQEEAKTDENTIPIIPISIAGITGALLIAGGTVIINKNRKSVKK